MNSIDHIIFVDLPFSTFRWLVGLFMGTAIAVTLFVFSTRLPFARGVVRRLADFLGAVPIIALVTTFDWAFGTAELGKYCMIAWATSFPIYVSLSSSTKGLESSRLIFAAARATPMQVFLWLELPAAASMLISGIRIALGIGWISVVAAELLGVPETGMWAGGLGRRVEELSENHNYIGVSICLAAFGAAGLTSGCLFNIAARSITRSLKLDVC